MAACGLAAAAHFVVPFLLVRSFAFNAYNTAWRNVRFHFDGRYWACWRILVGYGLLTLVTGNLGAAVAAHFVVNLQNLAYITRQRPRLALRGPVRPADPPRG